MSFTSAIPTKFIVSSKQSFLSHRDRTTYTLSRSSQTPNSLCNRKAPRNGTPCASIRPTATRVTGLPSARCSNSL